MLNSKLKKLKFLLFDLDGVIFDSNSPESDPIYMETVLNKLKTDLQKAKIINIELGVISATEDDVIVSSLKNLGIKEVLSHSIDKVSQAEKVISRHNLNYDEIAYIGDDILDLPLLAKVGFSATTNLARREVKRAVNYIIKIDDSKTVLFDILAMIEKAKYSRPH